MKISLSLRTFAITSSLLLILLLSGCTSPKENDSHSGDKTHTEEKAEKPVANGYVRYTNQEHGFQIDFPEDWPSQEDFMGLIVMANSPLESDTDAFSENINVVMEELPSTMSTEKYLEANIKNMEMLMTDFVNIEVTDQKLGGVPTKRMEYSAKMGLINLHNYAYLFVSGKKGYVITGSATPESIDTYREDFDAIAETFAFL
jgi:hypothetical protein